MSNHFWKKATAVRFLYGRLHFHHPDGTRARANAAAKMRTFSATGRAMLGVDLRPKLGYSWGEYIFKSATQ